MEDDSKKLCGTVISLVEKIKIWEKVSLIFLLCETSTDGLQLLDTLLDCSSQEQNEAFTAWIYESHLHRNGHWSSRFVEALTIIQNYNIGSALGFKKEELKAKYLPQNCLKSVEICQLRKTLFHLCEHLTTQGTASLIDSVEKDFITIVCDKSNSYLEYKLLIWDSKNIIKLGGDNEMNMDAIVKHLNTYDLCKDITTVVHKLNLRRSNKGTTSSLVECYEIIDESDLGFCVIINEKHFHKSEVPEFQSLLPDNNFQTRNGTEKDVEKLEEVFSSYGFQVKVYNDVNYKELMHIFEYYSEVVERNHSFFTLVILSHGSENVIYTSDSVPVNIDEIELRFQGRHCPNLIGKPKIFVIQSCQGEEWQQIQTDTVQLPMRGFAEGIRGPERGDSVIAWSTVKGYASFRDRVKGSWFIQEFCDALLEHGATKDLVDIFTLVNNNLRGKTHQGQFMVPWLSLSVCKKIKFPSRQHNQKE